MSQLPWRKIDDWLTDHLSSDNAQDREIARILTQGRRFREEFDAELARRGLTEEELMNTPGPDLLDEVLRSVEDRLR